MGQPIHGMYRSPENITWMAMKQRCCNPNHVKYHFYGGMGITICQRWMDSFQAFFDDMGKKPGPHYSLDRFPDKDGNYEPSNCRWATPKEQVHNSHKHLRMLTLNGKTQCLTEWSEELSIPYSTLQNRLRRGWSVERALTAPIAKQFSKYK